MYRLGHIAIYTYPYIRQVPNMIYDDVCVPMYQLSDNLYNVPYTMLMLE